MATEQAPITALQKQQTTNSNMVSSLASLQSDITTMQGAAASMADPGLFAGRTATSSTANSTWSPVAADGTANGTYTVAVTALATAAAINGTSGLGSGLSPSSDVSALTVATLPIATPVSAGTFSVNGQQVNVATTDSLSQVFAAISTATGGTVTASYDNSTDKVSLTSSGGELILGAANDSSNFLSALKLANNGTGTVTSSGSLGVVNPTNTLAQAGLKTPITAVDGSGNGSFAINGVTINYNVNTATLGSIVSTINQAGAGVTAAYDPSNDRVTLTNNVTGNLGVAVSEAAGGLLDALGLSAGAGATLVRGANAQFSVNGGPVRSASTNSLSAADLGVPGLSLTVNTKDTQNVTVAGNAAGIRTAINNFVAAYNTLQTNITGATAITKSGGTVTNAILTNYPAVSGWSDSLRGMVFNAVPGLTGSIHQLADMGIDFTPGTNQLDIADQTKFSSALANTPNDVAALFQTTGTGLASQMSTFAAAMLKQDTTSQSTLTAANAGLATQITTIQARLTQQQADMTAGFVAMETAQSAWQSQLQALNSAFNTSSSSSSSGSSGSLPKLSSS